MMFLRFFMGFIVSFLVTYRLIPLMSSIAFQYNIVDSPDGVVKNHKKPTPYLGGVALYVGFLTALAVVFSFENQYFLLLVGSTLLLFTGLIDDLAVLSPLQKFTAQLIVVFCCLKSGLYLKAHFFHNTWSIIISALWCLTIINAFNLVDVMDGLATTLASLITLSLCTIAVYYGHHSLALLLVTFLGSLIAFLSFNRPPASIYLGDAGSLFLGGFLAPIPFLFNWGTYNWYGYVSPIIIFAIPLIEVISLVVIRSYKGLPFYKPSPDHFCLYLKAYDWKVGHILWYMVGLSTVQLAITFLFLLNYISFSVLFFIVVVSFCLWTAILVFGNIKQLPIKKIIFFQKHPK